MPDMNEGMNPALLQMLMSQMGNQGGAQNNGGINPAMLQMLMSGMGGNNAGGGINPALLQMLMAQNAQPQQPAPFSPAQTKALEDMMDQMHRRSSDEWMQMLTRQVSEQRAAGSLDAAAVRDQMEQLAPLISEAGRKKLKEIMQSLGI